MSRKQLILDNIEDLCMRFMYYDRKEDEDLEMGEIEEAVQKGEITFKEIRNHFKKHLKEDLDPCNKNTK